MPVKSGPSLPALRAAAIALLLTLSLLGGCKTRHARDLSHQSVETLYQNARKALQSNDYDFATKQYEALTARFPFSTQARQARLDLIFLYYSKGEKESAIDAAEEFVRENPTHPRCDYALYMQGLINYERVPYRFERWFGVDSARRPPTDAIKAVAAFGNVTKHYPTSIYAHDAQRRMIYLRDRLADYELNVANYYMKRGAYLAAAQRVQRLIEHYDGAPAIRPGLLIMIDAYDRMGLEDLKTNVEQVYALNYPAQAGDVGPGRKRHWWNF